MKKTIALALSVIALFGCAAGAGCKKKGSEEENKGKQETYEDKLYDGIDPVFKESMGYYNENPSVMQEGATRYLYYTRNEEKYNASTDSVAVRVGKYSGGKWNYSEAKKCVGVGAEGAWDSAHVFGADVVKGDFSYGGKRYSYLMAYSGSKEADKSEAQIGLAVAETPDGAWTKVGDKPLITFKSSDWDTMGLATYPGCIEPSLIRYGETGGKVYLFYEESENFKSNYVYELDLGDLDHIVKGGKKVLETTGVTDLGTSNPLLYGGDLVLDTESGELFAAREVRTMATSAPKVADGVQAYRAPVSVLDHIYQGVKTGEPTVWWQRVGGEINADTTAVLEDEKKINGYMRIFSPCIVSDAYGRLPEYGKLEILFTSQACDGDERLSADIENAYAFTQMIHTYTITY